MEYHGFHGQKMESHEAWTLSMDNVHGKHGQCTGLYANPRTSSANSMDIVDVDELSKIF